MTWTELSDTDKRAAVRDAIQNRHESYSAAAARLGTTRNGIAGVVERSRRSAEPIPRMATQRLQLVRREQAARACTAIAARPRRPREEKPVPKPRRRKTFAFVPDIPEDAFAEANIDRVPARTDVWQPLDGAAPIGLLDLGTHTCHWPLGDGPFTFCGQPVDGASVYCSTHSAIAFRPALPVTRVPKGARS